MLNADSFCPYLRAVIAVYHQLFGIYHRLIEGSVAIFMLCANILTISTFERHALSLSNVIADLSSLVERDHRDDRPYHTQIRYWISSRLATRRGCPVTLRSGTDIRSVLCQALRTK